MKCRNCDTNLEAIHVGNYWAWQCPNKECKKRTWSTLPRVDAEKEIHQVELEMGNGEL